MGRRSSFSSILTQLAREAERSNKRAAAEAKRQERERERAAAQQSRHNKQQYLVSREREAHYLNEGLATSVAQLRSILTGALTDFSGFVTLRKPTEVEPCKPPSTLSRPAGQPVWDLYKQKAIPAPRVGLFERLFYGKLGRGRRVELHESTEKLRLETLFQTDSAQWVKSENDRKARLLAFEEEYIARKAAYLAETQRHNAAVDELELAYLRAECDAVSSYNELLLEASAYPDGFPQNLEVDFVGGELVIEYQLPPLDVVPEVAEYRYVKTRDEIDPKPRKAAERLELYSSVVYSVPVRTLWEVYRADRSGAIRAVTFNGYLDGINPANGRKERMWVVSVRSRRESFQGIELSRVNPLACLKALDARLPLRLDAFTPVEPFRQGQENKQAQALPQFEVQVAVEAARPSFKVKPPREYHHGPVAAAPTAAPPISYAIPQPPPGVGSGEWIPAGQSVVIQGHSVRGGMLYVGSKLKAANGQLEPALINPILSVAAHNVDESVRLMDYWPCYSTISPEARRAYLQWLADGRRNPHTNVGYVFLFFYGLERRALVDVKSAPDPGEMIAIESEVDRLIQIYGHNSSFRRYASSFLTHIGLSRSFATLNVQDGPPAVSAGYELPLNLRVALGQMALAKTPMDAEWARVWALSDPNIYKRTPVTRCESAFRTLFTDKYKKRFPDGMNLPVTRTKLKAAYHPASAGLQGKELSLSFGDVPDVTASARPVECLQSLVVECSDELDSYSRFIGKNPGKEETLDALLQLPVSLWPAAARGQLEEIGTKITGGQMAISLGELSGRFNSVGALNRDKVLGFARALETLHVGMEPDVLAGARLPKPEDHIILFQTAPEDGSVRANATYQAAAITIGLAFTVASADGGFCKDEAEFLHEQVENWPELSGAHRKRLHAHLELQKHQPATLASYKKRLEPLSIEARRSIAQFLAHLAQADGSVSPKEIKLLEKVYKTLELDPKLVFSDLHQAPGSASVSPAAKPKVGGFSLDMQRIADLKKETEAVTAVLTRVFTDDEVPTAAEEEPTNGLLGLDSSHTAFMRLLFSRASWTRQELEDAAADMGLMPDGALEQINEASYEHFSEVLFEGEQILEVNQQVMEQLLA